VYVLTQYKALSLNRHIREGWTELWPGAGRVFELMPPMQRTGANWYMGTADAVYQNIYSIGSEQPAYVIILSPTTFTRWTNSRMLAYHKETGAEVTLATLPIPPDEVRGMSGGGGRDGRSVGFQEKPASTSFRSPFNLMPWMRRWGFTSSTPETLLKALNGGRRRHGFEARLRAQHPAQHAGKKRTMPTALLTRTSSRRSIGATWARWTLLRRNMDLCSVSPVST